MANTAQLTDRLDDLIRSACDGVLELLKDRFVEETDTDFPDLSDLDYSGAVHELIDGTVPVYTAELRELAYFHHDAALKALSDQFGSVDGDWPSGPFAAGLYCLIQAGVGEWYADTASDAWDAWVDALEAPAIRRAAIAHADAA